MGYFSKVWDKWHVNWALKFWQNSNLFLFEIHFCSLKSIDSSDSFSIITRCLFLKDFKIYQQIECTMFSFIWKQCPLFMWLHSLSQILCSILYFNFCLKSSMEKYIFLKKLQEVLNFQKLAVNQKIMLIFQFLFFEYYLLFFSFRLY